MFSSIMCFVLSVYSRKMLALEHYGLLLHLIVMQTIVFMCELTYKHTRKGQR